MRRLILLPMMCLPLLAAPSDDRWSVDDHESIQKTFKVATGDNVSKLSVDQINGYLHVTGGAGSEIRVKVYRHSRAESNAAMDEAKRDVHFDMTQTGNEVKLYEDGPFRHNDHGREHNTYQVTFDCDIEVPVGAALDLHTLNGAVEVTKSSGDFTVHTLNGKVDMEEIGGSGSAQTLNGSVKVAFSRNPVHDSTFHTLNGSVDLYFASNPDADLTLNTLHGGVYADFDVTTLPMTVKGQNLNNRTIYRSGGEMKLRAGKGGPQLSLHTLNGSIRLHSKGA